MIGVLSWGRVALRRIRRCTILRYCLGSLVEDIAFTKHQWYGEKRVLHALEGMCIGKRGCIYEFAHTLSQSHTVSQFFWERRT